MIIHELYNMLWWQGFAALRFHIITKKRFWNKNIEEGTISTYADSIDRNLEIVREFGLVYTIYFK